MKPSREQLTKQLVDFMQQTHVMMRTGAVEEWPEIELTMTQFRTVAFLSGSSHRMGSIAAYLETSLSSATSLVDRLVDKNLVERSGDPDDRRVVTCKLTPGGQEAMEKFWQIGRRSIEGLAEQMGDCELDEVVRAMKRLHMASLRARESVGTVVIVGDETDSVG